jgi:hypothetical protein
MPPTRAAHGHAMGLYLEYPDDPRAGLPDGRRGLLLAFGVIAVLIAGAGAAIVGLSAYSILRMRRAGAFVMPAAMTTSFVLANVMLLFVAGGIGWGGVAMIRCRRWVLAAGKAILPLALAIGLLVTELLIAEIVIGEEFIEGGRADVIGYVVAIGAIVLFGIALPTSYLVLFTRDTVRRTFEAYDPYPVWTDRYPRPVLVVTLWSFYLGLLASTWVGDPTAYCFGRFVSGAGVAVMPVTWAAALLLASAACARRNRIGWWLAAAVALLYPLSMVLTIWLGDPRALYADIAVFDSTTKYVETKLKQWPYVRINQTILCLVGGATALAYLLRSRAAFFVDDESATPTAAR